MTDFGELAESLEGMAPEAIATVKSFFEKELASKEQQFKDAMEKKYGVAPAVMADAETVVKDVAPVAVKAVDDALPQSAQDVINGLLSRINSLESSLKSVQSGNANKTEVMGQGDPIPHTLFLEDGSVVQNHPGVATHYSVTVPATATEDEQESVKRVIAAYPTA